MNNGQFYYDAPLTQVSKRIGNDPANFISEVVLPTLMVDKKTGKIAAYDGQNLKKPVNTVWAPLSEPNTTNFGRKYDDYGPLQRHALDDIVSWDEDQMTQPPFDAQVDSVTHLAEQMAIDKEINAAAALSDAGTLTQGTTLSGTSQWSDYGNSDPFTDIVTGANTMGKYGLKRPNTIFFSMDVWAQIQNHPALLERVKYSQLATLTTELFAQLLAPQGITKVIVAPAVYDTAAEGLDASNSYVWGKHVWLAYITPTPGLRTLNGGYTLTLNNGKRVESFYDWKKAAQYIRSIDYYQQLIMMPEAFYFIQNAVA